MKEKRKERRNEERIKKPCNGKEFGTNRCGLAVIQGRGGDGYYPEIMRLLPSSRRRGAWTMPG